MKSVKKELLQNGHIEVILMKDVAEEFASDPAIANLNGCRLLSPWVAKEPSPCDDEEDDSGNEDVMGGGEGVRSGGKWGVLIILYN